MEEDFTLNQNKIFPKQLYKLKGDDISKVIQPKQTLFHSKSTKVISNQIPWEFENIGKKIDYQGLSSIQIMQNAMLKDLLIHNGLLHTISTDQPDTKSRVKTLRESEVMKTHGNFNLK